MVTANAAIVSAGTNGDIEVLASNDSDLAIDISGYFAPALSGGLSFYNPAACRVRDTREELGERPILGSLDVSVAGTTCNIPFTAQAFVLNTTVVPVGPLSYLSAWPHGTVQPYVLDVNAPDGTVSSKMPIVGATNGLVSVLHPNHSLVVDATRLYGALTRCSRSGGKPSSLIHRGLHSQGWLIRQRSRPTAHPNQES